jgi:hypothetical protein
MPASLSDGYILVVACVYTVIAALVCFLLGSIDKRRDLYSRPLHHTRYYCHNGHYWGDKEPTPGTLCEQCIDEGRIEAWCDAGRGRHAAKIVSLTPPYLLQCPQHGEYQATRFYIGGKSVPLDKWIKYHRYEPEPIPVPVTEPIPEAHLPHLLEPENRSLLEKSLRSLYSDLHKQVRDMESDLRKHRTVQRVGTPVGITLSILLLLAVLLGPTLSDRLYLRVYLDRSIKLTSRLTILLQQVEKALTSLLLSGVAAASLTIVIVFFAKKLKPTGQNISWADVIAASSFSLLAELTFTRLVLGELLTIFGLIQSIALQFVPAVIFELVYNGRLVRFLQTSIEEGKELKKRIRHLLSGRGIEAIKQQVQGVYLPARSEI